MNRTGNRHVRSAVSGEDGTASAGRGLGARVPGRRACDLAVCAWLGVACGLVRELRVDESVGHLATDGHGLLELGGQVDAAFFLLAAASDSGRGVCPIALKQSTRWMRFN